MEVNAVAGQERLTFPKRLRLLKRGQFGRVFDLGRGVHAKRLLARVVPNGEGRPRLAFVTPRGLGCHAKRNRVERVMREAYRVNQHMLSAGVDVVVMPKRQWTDYRLAAAEPSMKSLLSTIERQFGPASCSSGSS